MTPLPVELINGLLHLGATGILAAILFYLQQQTRKDAQEDRKMFKEELKSERDQCQQDHERILNAIANIPRCR